MICESLLHDGARFVVTHLPTDRQIEFKTVRARSGNFFILTGGKMIGHVHGGSPERFRAVVSARFHGEEPLWFAKFWRRRVFPNRQMFATDGSEIWSVRMVGSEAM